MAGAFVSGAGMTQSTAPATADPYTSVAQGPARTTKGGVQTISRGQPTPVVVATPGGSDYTPPSTTDEVDPHGGNAGAGVGIQDSYTQANNNAPPPPSSGGGGGGLLVALGLAWKFLF